MLKILKLRRQLELNREKMKELEERAGSFSSRAAELETAMNEAKTEEDIALVETQGEELEAEQGGCAAEMETLGETIKQIEGEISELERNAPEGAKPEKGETSRAIRETEGFVSMNRVALRSTRANPFRQTRDERAPRILRGMMSKRFMKAFWLCLAVKSARWTMPRSAFPK